MPYFITCTNKATEYRSDVIVNHPVNLGLRKSIRKSTLKWYPDNTGVPSIIFSGCDTEWAFSSDKDRDTEFEKISAIKEA